MRAHIAALPGFTLARDFMDVLVSGAGITSYCLLQRAPFRGKTRVAAPYAVKHQSLPFFLVGRVVTPPCLALAA